MAMASQGMELATRSIDLLTALGNTANSPDSIQARGLVIPNENCFAFYQAILTSSPPKPVAIFLIQSSGSLGRLMAGDLHLRWLTSTVSGLFQYHSEQFIFDTICAFIFQARRPANKESLSKRQLDFNADRVKIQPVLDKIISSIWFYIVNSGIIKSGIGNMLPLPEELESICTKGHHLQSHKLGTVLAQLQRCKGELLIDSKFLIKNLTSWLIYHFTGYIRIVVKGKVIYSQNSGESDNEKRIEIRIWDSCLSDGECTTEANTTMDELNIYTLVAGDLQLLFRLDCVDSSLHETEPRIRSKLYHTSITYPSIVTGRGSIKNLIRCAAVQIVSWLLKLPVLRYLELQDLVFEVDARQANTTSEKNTRLANLLTRLPSILNQGWPEDSISTFIYARPVADDTDDKSSTDSEEELGDTTKVPYMKWVKSVEEPMLKTVIEYYPIIRDNLREVRKSCYCWACRHRITTKGLSIFRGCLLHKAFMEIMQLIAHAIADSFGCDDISAVSHIKLDDLGVLNVLGNISEGQLRWNDWFTVVARTYLGCPPLTTMKSGRSTLMDQLPQVKGLPISYAPTVLAVQYGGLAIVAPWIDMTIDAYQCKPFAMEAVVGRTTISNEDTKQFRTQGVEGDFAVIEARDAELLDHVLDKLTEGAQLPTEATIQKDDTAIDIDVILANSGPSRYQLWLRVSTAAQSRLIDPNSAMRSACRLDTRVKCPHNTDYSNETQRRVRGLVRTYSFNDILSLWSEAMGQEKTPAHEIPIITVSPLCDSYLKLNVVLSFSSHLPLILSSETACLSCIVEQAQNFGRDEESDFLVNGFVIVASNEMNHTDWSMVSPQIHGAKTIMDA
ncbi:uncharacterized protein F4822DRAFT_430277 [Hypoxylon trugodes]|uniref:uncharacterized protein n=1 Tax=Hypoxylon trugodes TaxID=326681 RepID=UPI00219F4521|nr:uncharacterized protein F4822DRAFT_430277 [Hypoxylon trugodes]KAI1387530.1 hypothetical protein F4822DRAFT_430277 [Hypoxylon trugodes]